MDIRMPEMDGIEATRRIVGGDGETPVKVLMLTTFDLDEYVYDALRAGASGFLLKDVPADQLVAGIRLVAQGDALLAPSVTRRLIDGVLALLARPRRAARRARRADAARGRGVQAAGARDVERGDRGGADRLRDDREDPRGRVLMKLEVRDRVQAVVLAYESGVVAPGDAGS